MKRIRNAKRFISALLASVMVLSWVPGSALTAYAAEAGLCDHHTEHTEDCGYRAASPGAPCKYDNLCDKDCKDADGDGRMDHARDCVYTREMEKDLCDKGCTDSDGDGFADHAENCAFTQAKGVHKHNAVCGYGEADAGAPCGFQCEQCAALTAALPAETSPKTTVPETTAAATVPETTAEATVPEETLSPVQQIQKRIDALPEHVTEENRETVTAQLQEFLALYAALTEAEQEQIDISPCIRLQEELEGANRIQMLGTVTGGTDEASAVAVKESDTIWDGGYFIVNQNVTLGGRVRVKGNVILKLNAGCKLTASEGIAVTEGNTLTIEGSGTLEAIGSTGRAGIGGNYQGDANKTDATGGGATGGTITINGGIVIAKGGTNAAGIGGGDNMNGPDGISGGTFSTADNGNAWIEASSISDNDDTSTWSGVIFQNGAGQVYGDQTLNADAEIPSGKTLSVPQNTTLAIGQGATLTNNGTITNNGTLSVEYGGKLEGNGKLEGQGKFLTVKYQDVPALAAAEGTVDVTLKPATLSITGAALAAKTYDGSTGGTVENVTFSGAVPDDALAPGTDYTATAQFADPNAGTDKTATVTVTLTNENYTFADGAKTAAYTLTGQTIDPKTVTDPRILVTPDSYEYTGEPITPTKVTVYDGNNEIPAGEYTVAYSGNTDVGTAAVTITDGNPDGNYTITEKSGSFAITKRLLGDGNASIRVDSAPCVYDGTKKTPAVTVTYKDDEVSSTEYTVSYENNVSAGDATVTVTAKADGNYDGARSATFPIAPKPITVTVTPNGGVYGGEIQKAAAKLDESGIVPGDVVPTVTLTYTGKANDGTEVNSTKAPRLAGTYTVTASINSGNYTLTGKPSETFVIDRAESGLTVAGVPEKTYGDEDFALTVTRAGDGAIAYASGNPGVVTVDTAGKVRITGAGTAKIRVTVAETANYAGQTVEVPVTVKKRPVTVTVANKTKTYGDPNPELTYEVTAGTLVGNDVLKLALASPGENAGVYDITDPNAEKGNPNYALTVVPGKLTIERKDIKDAQVVLGPALTANGQPQTQTVKRVTVKNSQGKTLEATYAVTGNTETNAGGYTMTITGTGNFAGSTFQTFAIAPGAGQPVQTDGSGNPVLGAGKITEQVSRGSGAPSLGVGISKTAVVEILTESGDITAQELAQVADGTELKIVFPIRSGVSAGDRDRIKALAKGYTVGSWFDISLYKQLGDGDAVWLYQTDRPIRLTVQVPEGLLNTRKNITRTFWVIRCHDGRAEFLPTQYDDGRDALSFETDRFSGYAIVYKDARSTNGIRNTATGTSPRTGDSSRMELWIAALTLSAVGVGVLLVVRRKNNKKKPKDPMNP